MFVEQWSSSFATMSFKSLHIGLSKKSFPNSRRLLVPPLICCCRSTYTTTCSELRKSVRAKKKENYIASRPRILLWRSLAGSRTFSAWHFYFPICACPTQVCSHFLTAPALEIGLLQIIMFILSLNDTYYVLNDTRWQRHSSLIFWMTLLSFIWSLFKDPELDAGIFKLPTSLQKTFQNEKWHLEVLRFARENMMVIQLYAN